jgi:hypothetical protein
VYVDLQHYLVNLVVVVFGKNGMCTKLGGNQKGFPINVMGLIIPWILVNPNSCIWLVVCYLT